LYLKQAKALIEEASFSEFTDEGFQQIMRFLDQAEAAYEQVLQLDVNSVNYGVPVKDIARLGQGDVHVSRGIALQGYASFVSERAEFQEARQEFEQAIEILNGTLPSFQSTGLMRYLAQNHQFLGSAYQNHGYLLSLQGDARTARQSYEQALAHFDACIALGETTNDRIVQVDIVEANCQVDRRATEELLQLLEGGS
jgi:tetratricopeptide (TPR) repeat protein